MPVTCAVHGVNNRMVPFISPASSSIKVSLVSCKEANELRSGGSRGNLIELPGVIFIYSQISQDCLKFLNHKDRGVSSPPKGLYPGMFTITMGSMMYRWMLMLKYGTDKKNYQQLENVMRVKWYKIKCGSAHQENWMLCIHKRIYCCSH